LHFLTDLISCWIFHASQREARKCCAGGKLFGMDLVTDPHSMALMVCGRQLRLLVVAQDQKLERTPKEVSVSLSKRERRIGLRLFS
jgi:hypothetical protein